MRCSAPATRRAAWLAIVCHVLVASGLPLPLNGPSVRDRGTPAARAAKDRSRPFPCMDKPCGCATAEQCFANCCCHTPAERLAWAQAHRAEPAVLAALERRMAAATSPATGQRGGHAAQTCRAAAAESAVHLDATDVCSAYRSLAAAPPAADVPAKPAPPIVILRDMLACSGIVTAWLACGVALPLPRVEPPAHDAFAGAVAVRDTVAPSATGDVAVPPPRVA